MSWLEINITMPLSQLAAVCRFTSLIPSAFKKSMISCKSTLASVKYVLVVLLEATERDKDFSVRIQLDVRVMNRYSDLQPILLLVMV